MTRRPRAKGGFHYYYQAGGRKLPLGTDLLIAKEEWARLEANGPKLLFPKISHLYRSSDAFKALAGSTQDHYERALDNLDVYFRRVSLEQIQPRHVKQYIRKRSRKGAAIFEKRVGSALFAWAREEGHTAAPNPFLGVKFSKAERRGFEATGRRKVYVTEGMFGDAYGRGDEVLQDVMDLAYLAGQRPGDILKARRADILDGVWWVDQQKTGKRVGIRLEGELTTVMERVLTRPRTAQSVYIIADGRGQRVSYASLRYRFQKARGGAKWQFRDIRAKTATDADDLKHAQNLLGHEDERTTATVYRRARGNVVSPLKKRPI